MARFSIVCCALVAAALTGCDGGINGGEQDGEGVDSGANQAVVPPTQTSARAAAAAEKKPDGRAIGDWPCWRGPRGDGVSDETGWKSAWSGDEVKPAWRASVGIGYSSVSVVGERLYTMGREGDQDVVWCLNTANGEVVWTFKYDCRLVDNLHRGGPAATPTVDGDNVYTVSKEGHLHCLGAVGGEMRWKASLSELAGVKMPEWGFSCSPLVADGLLVIEAGRVVALDKRSGGLVWKTEAYRPGYGSPTRFNAGGDEAIAVLNNDNLLVVRTRDGSEVDRFGWETQYTTTSTTPLAAADMLFISTGYNRGCALLKLVGGKLELQYENTAMRNHMSTCVLWQDHLYGFDGNSHQSRLVNLVCMELATGNVKWKEGGLGCGALMIADGKLIVLSEEGKLIVAPAVPTGFAPTGRAEAVEPRCWTQPVLAHGRIYCRNDAGDLAAIDVR